MSAVLRRPLFLLPSIVYPNTCASLSAILSMPRTLHGRFVLPWRTSIATSRTIYEQRAGITSLFLQRCLRRTVEVRPSPSVCSSVVPTAHSLSSGLDILTARLSSLSIAPTSGQQLKDLFHTANATVNGLAKLIQ
ncbi:MAG TPA: hypothetical protein VN457_03330, partial [Chlamydiales bacterium]|nr:hypothetical protein [Chlamydiales bacterium]